MEGPNSPPKKTDYQAFRDAKIGRKTKHLIFVDKRLKKAKEKNKIVL